MLRVSVLSLLIAVCSADLYMHCPRGSNNRLNEASANRNNANRCFDSQNNNRGGYNVGEIGAKNGFGNQDNYFNTFEEGYSQGFWTGNEGGTSAYFEGLSGGTSQTQGTDTDQKQTESFYYEGSLMAVTWTNQHGCGENAKVYCQLIAQILVENMQNAPAAFRANGAFPNTNLATATSASLRAGNAAGAARYDKMRRMGLRVMLQNGANTNTPSETASTNMANINTEYNNNVNNRRCQHEGNEWYSLCRNKERNKGLFIADQKVNDHEMRNTRQNPNGNRRGLECPEERDYYPHWSPTPFIDVAILTDDLAYCNDKIVGESQNTADKWVCTTGTGTDIPTDQGILDALNQTQCTAAGGTWESFKWDMPAPDCLMAPRQQVNHLGNMITNEVSNSDAGGSQAYFMWKLPSFADLTNPAKAMGMAYTYNMVRHRNLDGSTATGAANAVTRSCVRLLFRLRYNISTTDYDPYNTDSRMNDKPNDRIISPIKQNPTIEMGVLNQGLRLAINTAQTGRTFQDRSHTMLVCKRELPLTATDEILNVQVQGKRGNIVQTFPATEYQFSPRQFTLCPGNVFHFQWTGSNTHNNGNPAGDGQAGDAGEGRGGSDRSNLVEMLDMQRSYPMASTGASLGTDSLFNHLDCYQGMSLDKYATAKDAAIAAGTSGYYHGVAYAQEHKKVVTASATTSTNQQFNDRLQVLFNNAAASYRAGIVCKAKASLPQPSATAQKFYAFMSTRNNNFSNRAQKLKIYTGPSCTHGQAVDANNPSLVGSMDKTMMLG